MPDLIRGVLAQGSALGARRSALCSWTAGLLDADLAFSPREDPQQLRRHTPDFTQHMVDGRPAGILIADIPAGTLLAQAGFRPGDILIAVDGQSLTVPTGSPSFPPFRGSAGPPVGRSAGPIS